MPYYAVRNGRNPGMYSSWEECKQQTDGYSNAKFQRFDTQSQAKEFMSGGGSQGGGTYRGGTYGGTQAAARVNCDRGHVPVYTDGACSNNGRSGASGGIGVYWGPGDQRNVSERLPGRQTNIRAEIVAAETALRQAKATGRRHVTINTDSEFVIKGITEYIDTWKSNGWKTATGQDVVNRADFEALDRARADLCVDWKHVPGHQGCSGNVEADKLAVAGARK